MENWSRRKFFFSTMAGAIAASARGAFGAVLPKSNSASHPGALAEIKPPQAATSGKGKRPTIISAHNGLKHLDRGMDILKSDHPDTLDAVLAVVTQVENDPNDHSVGYGGLPNEDGVVQLDACVMHGPTGRCGAVGAIEGIKNPSLVARAVMERTNHTFIVGAGAEKFAVDEGFEAMNLLTEESRLAWLAWKASSSKDWRPGLDSPDFKKNLADLLDTPEKLALLPWIENVITYPPTGTINCLAVNEKGEMSGTTTTSGLAWKISDRVGDSPIIGAGLFVDQEVGGGGSTGRGEENIKIAGGHTIVEMMRKGMSPTDACLEAMHRVVHNYKFDPSRLKMFDLEFYALNKDGEHGAATLWSSSPGGRPISYAVHDGSGAKLVPCTPMYQGVGGDY
ncbi:MAG TPA: N(4)-(beta-N-acetylglucosaminyl)-L-asparaginase [Candidatus Acidoferrales bacterium]|nr:N(4)-(beta-N-acetylglucosaminyl)-L-asparaginase [Candidatus Acidoferrales bacterium]